MRRLLILIVIVALVFGGPIYLFHQDKISGVDDLWKWVGQSVSALKPDAPEQDLHQLPVSRPGETLRIASFNVQVLGSTKMAKPHVVDVLARIIRQFDIVAIQEIRSKDQSVLPQLVDLVNATGRHYDYVIGPRLGRTSSKEQYAFVFDRASVDIDRNQLYTVDDPDDLLHREPLVAWFRVRGPAQEEAFTFTLVNVHTDPDETDQELDVLDDVFRVVRDDGRMEDDVILLGDLNVNDQKMGQLGEISGIHWVISNMPTNTRGTSQYDNLVFHGPATSEFTGRSGVFDFLKVYNMTLQEALEISDHLPVWAEFSIREGGVRGHVASSEFLTSPAGHRHN